MAEELQKLGGAKVVLATVTSAAAMADSLGGLGINGKLVVLGATFDPLPLPLVDLLLKRRSVQGWPCGRASIDSVDTMKFAVQSSVRPMIETYPLERAAEGYERMMSGRARFRASSSRPANIQR